MQEFGFALIATIGVSAISLIGALTLFFRKKSVEKFLLTMVGLSAGALLSGAFFHLIPESLEVLNAMTSGAIVLIGIIIFFIIEKILHWRHCHKGKCKIHTFSYMNLIGDAVHNFIDGLIIIASFMTNISTAITSLIAIILHEIPQEIGDFGVLVYGGIKRSRALLYNFISALFAVLGVIIGYLFSSYIENFSAYILPFAAGGFIYIASSDLIPQLHKTKRVRDVILPFVFFIIGILLVGAVSFFE
ncbi:MAG: ZIP family metal transporter [Candidatus Nanoarchaeia archaeon]|nr:ZIP family metal transporter [Candidatus Nanoarchaeia archaeon]